MEQEEKSGLTHLHDCNACSSVDLSSSAVSIFGKLCMLGRRERPSLEILFE